MRTRLAICVLWLLIATVCMAEDLTKVRFVTDWKAEAAHGGYYQAKALGLYAQAGLDVQIIQGGSSVNVPLLLGSNQADFAIGSNSFIPLNSVQAGALSGHALDLMSSAALQAFTKAAFAGVGLQGASTSTVAGLTT